MKKMFVALMCVFILACEGPTGPAGKDGEDINITAYTGSLGFAEYIEYWTKTFEHSMNLNNAIVNVRVRKNSESEWFEPVWTNFQYELVIYKTINPKVQAGYEYRILIAR